jgi:plasmid maintenance system antidote protein VapI
MIKSAYADVEKGIIQRGADVVKFIIHESNITAEEKDKYQKIYDNSRLYYIQLQTQYFPQPPIQ